MNNKILGQVIGWSGTLCDKEGNRGKVVLCHGCFDILHAGHLEYFKEAKSHGDILIVTVTTDKYINKGPGRPYFSHDIRAEMLAALEIIDYVAIVDDPIAVPAINAIKPDFYVKGPDYRDHSTDLTGGIIEEEKAIHEVGGCLIYTSTSLCSSSAIANRFFIKWSDEQKRVIEKVKEAGGMPRIKKIMEELSILKVFVLGEPIIDVYKFVEPMNISSKYPCVSAEFLEQEMYDGGSWAIYSHIWSFVDCSSAHTQMLALESKLPRKTRFISKDKQQRMFELTETRTIWDYEFTIQQLNENKSDITILADFGHGLFNKEVLEACSNIKSFVALNVQTNSSNYGFNTFQRHKRWDYLVLDKRETQLAYHDNKTDAETLALRTAIDSEKRVSVTLGASGASYFPGNKIDLSDCYHSPAFADQIVDATGAGDAYFAITSLLVKVNAPPIMIPFIGNVFAGLKTKIIGNKESVSKASLMKALESILK